MLRITRLPKRLCGTPWMRFAEWQPTFCGTSIKIGPAPPVLFASCETDWKQSPPALAVTALAD